MQSRRWRFGVGQTPHQERAEIEEAKQAGRADAYLEGQKSARLIEAERQRRRSRKQGRRR